MVDTLNPTGYAQVLEELVEDPLFPSSLTVTKAYTYGHDLVACEQLTDGDWQTHYYGYDGHGSTRQLFDANGHLTDTYTYDAFGTLLGRTGTTDNHYLYCGEQWDDDLGLYYLRARYMNPWSGRFWSMDTFEGYLDDPLSLHKYLYAHANPVMWVDPSGMMTMKEMGFTITVTINNIKNHTATITVAGKKIIKKLTCEVGVSYFRREVKGLAGHHALQKSIGGSHNQPLIFVPSSTHNAFHSIQNLFFQAGQLLPGNASKAEWASLLSDNQKKRNAYNIALITAKLIDQACKLKKPRDLSSFVKREIKKQYKKNNF